MASALKALKGAGKASSAAKSIGKVAFKSSKKVAKGAKTVAKKGAKIAKSPAGKKALKYGAAAAALGGGAMYLDKKLKDKSAAVKECTQVCLPEGYDEHKYGGKPASTLVYRTIESAKEKGAEVDEDQPFCTADVGDCGDFCLKKCEEANPLDIPGAEIAKAGVGAVKGAVSFAAGGIWSAIKMPVYIGCGVLCCIILVYLAMMMGKPKPSAMAAAPPKYY